MSRKTNHVGQKHATGVITLVQENRFKLADDEGRSELFVLAHDAPLEAQDLQFLQRSQPHVTVVYTDADDLIAGVAHDVLPADRR